MQQIKAFIDLNTYRITNTMLSTLYNYCKKYESVDFTFYNYSMALHKSLSIKGKTLSALSGRRKVQIDIRIICDAIEAACGNQCDILLLCGIVDAAPFFDKLNYLNIKTIFATMQKVNVGATGYLMLSRDASPQEKPNKQTVNVANAPNTITHTPEFAKNTPQPSVEDKKLDTRKPIADSKYLKNLTVLPAQTIPLELSEKQVSTLPQTAISNVNTAKPTFVSPKTILKDDYDTKLEELNLLINQLKF